MIVLIKKIIAFLLLITFITAAAYCEDMSAATPTDISEEIVAETELVEELLEEEVEEKFDIDELYGDRKIEVYFIKNPRFINDTVILGFRLIDYPPMELQEIQWQISIDNVNWVDIEGANDETYEFVITFDNYKCWWRVQIAYKVII